MTDCSLTFKCNNNCLSCININEISFKKNDVPFDEVKEIINGLNSTSDYFGISGGEPTLSKDLFSVLKYVKDNKPDLYVFLLTNGRMFSYKKFIKKFIRVMPKNFRVAIPLYGHNGIVHDYTTYSKGSFVQAYQGIKNLLSEKIKVEIRPIISKINYKYLENIAQLVVKEFPTIDRFVFVNMKITGNAHLNFDKVGVKITDVWPYAEKAVEILIKNNIPTYLYHFPLCTVPKKYWDIAKGVTKAETWELTFVNECEKCIVKDTCPRIWKTYVTHFGDKEFKAIQ